MDLPRANAVFVVYQEPDSGKPLVERDSRILEDSPYFGRELLAAVEALPDASTTQEGMPLALAVWALDPVRPSDLGHKLNTDARVLEVASSFEKALREWFGFHGGKTVAKQVRCCKYIVTSEVAPTS
jgi:hypothetical protein